MNNFTEYILEYRKNLDSGSLLSSEVKQYLSMVNKHIPDEVKDVIYMTDKYNLLSSEDIMNIKNATKSSLKKLSTSYNIPISEMESLWKMIKDLKDNIKLLPQLQTEVERVAIEQGKASLNDLTIDLDTPAGRNAATKMYMPMIYKIVNQYVGKSSLSKQELISAALEGFTDAMNQWYRSNDPDVKKVIFKTYAGFRVKQQILNDINKHSHTLSGGNSYNTKKYGSSSFDALSLDNIYNNDDDDSRGSDHLAALGVEDRGVHTNEDESWRQIYKLIENKFKQRDVDVFYRFFGINGYKREKSKDIAKSIGVSEGNIRNSIINKILKFLRTDKQASEIIADLQSVYNESLMCDLCGLDKNTIIETLINDDMFILFEELTRWNNKNIFHSALHNSLDQMKKSDSEEILSILSNDFEYLDSVFKKYKKHIIEFLSFMYPTEYISRKTDVSLLEYMMDIQDAYKKFNK